MTEPIEGNWEVRYPPHLGCAVLDTSKVRSRYNATIGQQICMFPR